MWEKKDLRIIERILNQKSGLTNKTIFQEFSVANGINTTCSGCGIMESKRKVAEY